jgi:uncharacterized protein (DUF1697 family)
MPRYIALLRAINVGGRNVRMEVLRQLFESLGFSKVETFIASGNVVFETASRNAEALERKIENRLREALGYEVATFIRTDAELAAVASYKPFRQSELDAATALNIAFLCDMPDETSKQRLSALKTDFDDFHLHGREIYWLCRMRQSESKITNAVIEKATGQKSTLRGANTIKKMALKYSKPAIR